MYNGLCYTLKRYTVKVMLEFNKILLLFGFHLANFHEVNYYCFINPDIEFYQVFFNLSSCNCLLLLFC